MRSEAERDIALSLAGEGRSATEIARLTGIPRRTVCDWVAGKVPAANGRGGCSACGAGLHDFANLSPEYVYLLGMYLGDGCISEGRRGVYRLRVSLDLKYPEIIEECARAISVTMPKNRVGRSELHGNYVKSEEPSLVVLSSYSRSWPCLFPQHGPGRKHQRSIVLEPWQRELIERDPRPLLRGLIHSDGCRFINTGTNWRHPRYVLRNLSEDIMGIFKYGCELLGVHYTTAPLTVYVSRKKDVALFDEFIGAKR